MKNIISVFIVLLAVFILGCSVKESVEEESIAAPISPSEPVGQVESPSESVDELFNPDEYENPYFAEVANELKNRLE